MSSSNAASVDLPSFVPRRGLSNGHVMTVYGWAKKREFPALPTPEARYFQTTPDTQVLGHCYWQAERHARPTLVALHGLEGASDRHYMRGMASQAWQRGWNAVCLNHRNCGGTEGLTPTLYHSALTADAFAVITELTGEGFPDFGVAGYSLGGNLTLRIAAELATEPARKELPIRATVAVSPTIDLHACISAIERGINVMYQRNFLKDLRARMLRKAAIWPDRFDLKSLEGIRTIREFDNTYTAPQAGFGTADNYYTTASAMRVVDRIEIPTLIVSAEDDPFVPSEQFGRPEVAGNPHVRVLVTDDGGHCGFVSRTGYWAEETVARFLAAFMPS